MADAIVLGVYTHTTGGGEWHVGSAALAVTPPTVTHTETLERLVLAWCGGSCWAIPIDLFRRDFRLAKDTLKADGEQK